MGKSTDGPDGWPYFNLEMPGGRSIAGRGLAGAMGQLVHARRCRGLRVAGQELTHLVLKPGEEIRTPLIAMLFWQGTDVVCGAEPLAAVVHRAQHAARERPEAPAADRADPGGAANKTSRAARAFLTPASRPDLCWRDAGWYPSGRPAPTKAATLAQHGHLGCPTQRSTPRASSRSATGSTPAACSSSCGSSRNGWAIPNSWLGKNHPEWLLPGTSHGALLNEGNPAARKWLIDHVDGMIKSQGIDWYREDMNGGGRLAPGDETTRRTARGSRRTSTCRGIWRSGTNCDAAIPACASIPAPPADVATIWRPCAEPCRCCAAISSLPRITRPSTGRPTAFPVGYPSTGPAFMPAIPTRHAVFTCRPSGSYRQENGQPTR